MYFWSSLGPFPRVSRIWRRNGSPAGEDQKYPRPATVKQLRQFLGTLNFYRRFLPNAAADQAKLNGLIGGPKKKGKSEIEWTPELNNAFERCKKGLARTTLLAHPDPEAKLALTTDASDTALGAVIQQQVKGEWQPLAFFSKKLNPAQTKYSPYDRELLAIYESVKYYQHMLEGRNFTIYTDHKPIHFPTKSAPQLPTIDAAPRVCGAVFNGHTTRKRKK